MDKNTLKKIFVILAAALVLIPSLLSSVGIVFDETTGKFLLSFGIVMIMAFVLVDIKDVSKKKAMGKLAACVGLLYALVMQWIG